MNEGEIRMQAQMYALVASMHAINARIESMKAANLVREDQGYSLAFGEDAFAECEDQLGNISSQLLTTI